MKINFLMKWEDKLIHQIHQNKKTIMRDKIIAYIVGEITKIVIYQIYKISLELCNQL